MIVFKYDTGEIERIYNLKKDFLKSDFIIIDNEIQNDISSDWDYTKARISVVGILLKNNIEIYVAESEDDKEFKDKVRERLKILINTGKIYSFNKFMEMGNFKGDLDFDIEINEIKPFNAKGWSKDRFFKELQSNNIVLSFNVYDPFEGNSSLCVDNWEEYLKTKNVDKLKQIVFHNINCLVKENLILKHNSYFKENYKTNEKNWLVV